MTSSSSIVQQSKALPMYEILGQLAAISPQRLAEQWPDLDPNQIKAALTYAADLAQQQAELPVWPPTLSEKEAIELDLNKVLVVDDNEDNLILMQHIFKKSNFTLCTVSNPEDALTIARTERPVLIVSDVQMPYMSGFDLLNVLKTDEQTKNIAVILVTAHHLGSNQASQGLIMGADDYIQRPFMPDEFMSRVEAVVRLKRTEIETRLQAQGVAQRNRRLKWVNDLALAVNSSLELSEIFDSSMQKLSQLLEAEAVSIVLVNQESQKLMVNMSSHREASISVSLDFDKHLIDTTDIQTWVSPVVSKVFNQHAADLGLDILSETHTVHAVPMQNREQLIGTIAIIDKQRNTLDDADWVLLNSAAGIIVVAVENARLLEHAQQQVDDLIALTEIGRVLTSNLDLEQTLKHTTLFVQRSLQCEAVSMWLLDERRQRLTLTTASGVGADAVTGFGLPVERGIVGHVATTGEAYISEDVSKDEFHFVNTPNKSTYKPGSILSIPVQVKGEIIGVMQALHQKVGWFTHEHLRLSYPVANFVGIAVENARLFGEVQDFNRHLERMVSERTRELAEEKEKTEAILASMADALLVLDAEKCILMANKAAEQMLDFQLQGLLGKPIGPAQLTNPLWQYISEIISHDELIGTALIDVPAAQTGALLSIQTNSAKVYNELDQVIGTVIVLRDITALKEVERMKSQFMAGVTHELKTPLSVIRLHAKNLSTYHERLPAQKQTQLLNSIQTQAELLSALIEDILELSRFDAGVIESEREMLNVAELIDRTVNDLRPLADSKQIKLQWERPTAKVTTLADPLQIGRIIRNLVDNAIKYTPEGGVVRVETYSANSLDKNTVNIRVTDSGLGIPPDHLAQIFERFHRVDPSHTIPGTGLGLSIVKEIVNNHDGHINVESQAGQGSTFTVELPSTS